MTPDQFDAAIADTRITPDMIAAARRVLVGGEAPADVARDIGITRQQLNQTLQRIRQAAGLVTASVTLPAEHRAALGAWVAKHGGAID